MEEFYDADDVRGDFNNEIANDPPDIIAASNQDCTSMVQGKIITIDELHSSELMITILH